MPKSADSTPATRADIDELIGMMRDFMHQTPTEFAHAEEKNTMRFYSVNDSLNKIEAEIVDLKKSFDRLAHTVDAIIARIDTHETEMAARDAQFNPLIAWAKKVSKQTGIPLEGF